MTNTKKKKSKKNFLDKLKDVDYKTLLIENLKKLNNFFRYNVQFISFVILCLISCALLRHYTINKFIDFEATFFDFAVIVLLGSLAYLFKPRKQFWYFFSVMNVITLMNIINTVYTNIYTRVVEIGVQRAIGMSLEGIYRTFLWEGVYYGGIAALIGGGVGYLCLIFVEAAKVNEIGLIPFPLLAMAEAALVSILVCLAATWIPLWKIRRMNIVESMEAAE